MDTQEIQIPDVHIGKMINCASVVEPANISTLLKYINKMYIDVLPNEKEMNGILGV